MLIAREVSHAVQASRCKGPSADLEWLQQLLAAGELPPKGASLALLGCSRCFVCVGPAGGMPDGVAGLCRRHKADVISGLPVQMVLQEPATD